MLWINFLHCYQPANSDAYKIKEASDLSYKRIIEVLEKNPNSKFTINISACLVSRLVELKYLDLIERINVLIDKGQIELTGSASYHALLPLLKENEIVWQIKENETILKKYFPKAKLKGFFLPEMAYSPETAQIVKKLGYSWLILDEISYQNKKKLDPEKVYLDKNSGLKVIFRSRKFSNCYVPDEIIKFLEKNKNHDKKVIISGTDGELYGLRHQDLGKKLEEVLAIKEIKTTLISKYIAGFKNPEKINIRKSNWESNEKNLREKQPYHLWHDKKNEIHMKLWKLANMSINLGSKYRKDENYNWSRWHLVRGLASCTFWWASANDFKHNFGPYAWNPDEIERGANELIRSIRSLEFSTSHSEKIKSENIFVAIKKSVWAKHWNYYSRNKLNTNNKINKLLRDKYVLDLFNRKILPFYPDFKKIEKIKIIYHKDYIWESTYHVVLEFKTFFSYSSEKSKKLKTKALSFFCTAHSSEPRKNVYDTLNYLWNSGFSRGFLTVPKPMFYSKYFNASFYRGVKGESLLHYIKKNNKKDIEKTVKKTAEWLAKLHKTPISNSINLNKKNNRIKTVVPGYRDILRKIEEKYNDKYVKDIQKIYDFLIDLEDDFFELSSKRWLIHGDAHPENIIKIGRQKIAMIDFTDICVSDFARDLGTFIQQLEYKLIRYNYTKGYIQKIKDFFIETYCKNAKIKYNIRLKERVKLYYHWTAVRTSVFWLLRHDPKPDRAEVLIAETKNKLKIK
ncbi:MAG: phosphotransferase [Patescibacteria group bacterium]|jgi:aminoglycoside phosphotransferase (APT) family kinase protein